MTNDNDNARDHSRARDDGSADQRRWGRPGSTTAANWIAQDERMDRMHATFGDRVLERAALQPGEVVIDVGCGTGHTTLAAWQAVAPTGTVLGVDVSSDMLDRARQRCAQAPGVSLVQADAQGYPFPPGHADAVISRFGVAHFADTTTAFVNLRAALRPGGRMVFAEWGPQADNLWMTLVDTVARRVLPAVVLRASHGHGHGHHPHGNQGEGDHPHGDQEHGVDGPGVRGYGVDGPGVHGHAPEFADAASIRAALQTAGWQDIQVALVADRAWLGSSPDEIVDWVFATELPSPLRLLDRVLLHRFRSALTGELSRFADGDGDGVRLPAAAWLVAATNPATPDHVSGDPS